MILKWMKSEVFRGGVFIGLLFTLSWMAYKYTHVYETHKDVSHLSSSARQPGSQQGEQ